MIQLGRAEYFKLHGEPQGDSRAALLANAGEWLRRVNLLLVEMYQDGIEPGVDQESHNALASGYRPAGVNAATANAAAGSRHLICGAGDVQDFIDRRVAVWCCRNEAKLVRLGLWMEDPRWTGGRKNRDPWAHLQMFASHSGNRIYIPVDPLEHPAGDPTFYADHGLERPAYLTA